MKTIFQNIKLIILGIIVAIGVSYAYAQVATNPSTVAPGNNIALPVHQLTGAQVKTGGLAVNGFSAYKNSILHQDSFFKGIIKGVPQGGNTSTVFMGAIGSPATTIATGTISNKLSLGSDDLSNTSNSPVCGDTQGHIILCPTGGSGGPICGNAIIESGEQCDDGNTANGDGCSSTCQNEAPTAKLVNIGASSQPVMGGTNNTNVVCYANMDFGGGTYGTVNIRYTYDFGSGGSSTGYCWVTTDPLSGSGTDYPGMEYYGQDVNVLSYCLESADVPVDPSVTKC